MVLTRSGKHLFVANANPNTVSIYDTQSGEVIETNLGRRCIPSRLPGSTHDRLALSPDQSRLFVANADNKNVAVFDVSRRGRPVRSGFIPWGWYPNLMCGAPRTDGAYWSPMAGNVFTGQHRKGHTPGVRTSGGHHRRVHRRAFQMGPDV